MTNLEAAKMFGVDAVPFLLSGLRQWREVYEWSDRQIGDLYRALDSKLISDMPDNELNLKTLYQQFLKTELRNRVKAKARMNSLIRAYEVASGQETKVLPEVDSIRKTLAGIDMRGVVSRYGVELKRSGVDQLKGLCPFHSDKKNPNFFVWPDHGHCFACGWHGDVLNFVKDLTGKSTSEALKEVAYAA